MAISLSNLKSFLPSSLDTNWGIQFIFHVFSHYSPIITIHNTLNPYCLLCLNSHFNFFLDKQQYKPLNVYYVCNFIKLWKFNFCHHTPTKFLSFIVKYIAKNHENLHIERITCFLALSHTKTKTPSSNKIKTLQVYQICMIKPSSIR